MLATKEVSNRLDKFRKTGLKYMALTAASKLATILEDHEQDTGTHLSG